MGPFALPVPGYRLGAHHRLNKRKKTDDTHGNEEEEGEEIWIGSDWGTPSSSRLPSDSINPLSHGPDTLRQFAVAGLSPADEIPSKANPLFPHKPLRPEGGSASRGRRGAGKDTHDGGRSAAEMISTALKTDATASAQQLSERLQHLATLTTILHRCLAEGDLARAKRAFGLLVRTRDVDIRQAGLWAIGSEILMREGEQQHEHEQEQNPEQEGQEFGFGFGFRRWGSAANVEKVKTYLETLVQQHPHDAHRPHLTSALDFWPALFGVEVYNVDAERRAAEFRLEKQLQQLQQEQQEQEQEYGFAYGVDADMAYLDEEAFATRRGGEEEEQGRERRGEEEIRAAREEIRARALAAAEAVARHMDQVMENAPYGAHGGLLRLRAHLALYVGDLCLPARLIDDDDNDNDNNNTDGSSGSSSSRRISKKKKKGGKSKKNGEDELRMRAETAEEHAALARRRDERDRARALFRKLLDGGRGGEAEGEGGADSWVRKFVDEDEDDEMDERGDDEW
ncbi:uncharacterized protein F4812DRAFT_116211 [Daldinia caldariorum]|uniref:uncharacterized protein n=1 Tax=Daldinia caldariorum TaxID=326644 RepID=UPI0020079405|nr:uncharacterized protein F4812DRAFT_116211 [Daldinia caldariorum]KAI1465897.1 hypothetical protein F4812DRAFT_116211 [Daldinia caldariorum]